MKQLKVYSLFLFYQTYMCFKNLTTPNMYKCGQGLEEKALPGVEVLSLIFLSLIFRSLELKPAWWCFLSNAGSLHSSQSSWNHKWQSAFVCTQRMAPNNVLLSMEPNFKFPTRQLHLTMEENWPSLCKVVVK